MSVKKPFISDKSPIMSVFCGQEFNQLSDKEKQYSYNFSKASWEGAKICYFQKSYEAPALFTILQLTHSGQSTEELRKSAVGAGVTDDEFTKFLFYSAGVFNNCGNFNSFGDDKFVPELSPSSFEKILSQSHNYRQYKELIDSLYADIQPFIFGHEGRLSKIGYPPVEGSTGYYSGNLTKEEIEKLDDFLKVLNVDTLNTRLVKFGDKHYGVLVASVNRSKTTHYYLGEKIDLIYGDYSPILRRVSHHLEQAIPFAANKNQEKMLVHYVNHFNNGNIEVHKDSQRAWVKDQGPIVETNIGFIETYLDPRQVRAEFEGFVAVVDKERSVKTNYFVSRAPEFLKKMPWPSDFEKDVFLKPDFTCLSVLSFGSSGTPLGINIPNYDDIRQEEGFKNVYLGNCITSPKELLFLDKEDIELKIKHFPAVIYHKVIFHELLGHGCGKLFYEGNYDAENILNPLTNEKGITKCYKPNETWGSVFKNLSNPYEECRADSVALYFSTFKEAYEVLQPEQVQHWEEISTACFLEFVYQALIGLQFYNADDKKWGQAHINGRWVILQVLLEAGNGFVEIEKSKHPEDANKDWIKVKVDRSQIFTTGKEAMRKFLLKMQVLKSTADVETATEWFGNYSKVNDKFLEIRKIVIDNKKPRRLELQGNVLKDFQGNISYKTYPETVDGVIQSYIERFPYFDKEVVDLWNEYRKIQKPSL
ncbi:hypothetical protein ABPG74_009999 [Tetrahymena malaccensis]